jgi:tetratricopeptide (TPR) repeat protein
MDYSFSLRPPMKDPMPSGWDMLGSLRDLAPRIKAWSMDRSDDQVEGERLLEQRDYPRAELHLTKAVLEEKQHQSPSRKILLRLELAEAQRRQFRLPNARENPEKLTAAEETARAALELAKAAEPSVLVQCLDALTEILAERGNYPEVELLTQDAILAEVRLRQADPLRMARRVHRLGMLRHKNGQIDGAVQAFTEAVAIREKVHGEEHLETAHQLTELGVVYRAQGKHAEAQRCLRRALRIHERECGVDSPEADRDLHQLAGSLEDAGDIDGATAQYERALGLKLRIVGADLDDIAEMQAGLARIFMKWQNYSRSRELLMEAIGTFKRTRGARLAAAYETLAEVEENSGHHREAIRELSLAGKVWETVQTDHAAELIRNMEHRAGLFDLLHEEREAAFLRERAAALIQATKWATAS